MVFYRKYRPQKFSDIIGQEHIVQVLTNALATGSFSHGYLFAGPRGSGKTTLARIFAKALNCIGRKLGKNSFEPCNKCFVCKEITAGKLLDLIEIDAASNRGIDEIRELREKIRFVPVVANFKVYIIDEVHMLTKEAFNALLKTLEEPPKHAIFIMATTEPQKVLPTILSRVQRFDFHRAEIRELRKLLNKVAKEEEIKIDEDALELLSQLSFGSYRDALSLFGQVCSLRATSASKVTLEKIQEILGLAQDKSVFEFLKFLAESNRPGAFKIIAELYGQGLDLENFTLKIIEILRKITLLKFGEEQLFDLTKEQQEEVKKLAEVFEAENLVKMLKEFTLAAFQIKSAPLPQLPLEILVYGLTASKTSSAPTVSLPVTDSNLNTLWGQIVKEARTHNHSLAALLREAILADCQKKTITLAFKFKFHADIISGKRNTHIIESIIEKITGDSYKITCVVNPGLIIKKPEDSETELLNGAKEVFEVEE